MLSMRRSAVCSTLQLAQNKYMLTEHHTAFNNMHAQLTLPLSFPACTPPRLQKKKAKSAPDDQALNPLTAFGFLNKNSVVRATFPSYSAAFFNAPIVPLVVFLPVWRCIRCPCWRRCRADEWRCCPKLSRCCNPAITA